MRNLSLFCSLSSLPFHVLLLLGYLIPFDLKNVHAISGVFEFLSHENPPKIALICIIEILIILQFIVHVLFLQAC